MSLDPNPLSLALGRARADGLEVLDLTESNPTRAGLSWSPEVLHGALQDPALARYEPHPFGHTRARESIAEHAFFEWIPRPDHIVLTSGTSEAYSYLLRLLCDQGDEVLVPEPGYPLLDHVARLEGVVLRGYPLAYDGAWHVDLDALRARVTDKCRAVVVVNPNNPTGNYLKRSELEEMTRLNVPIISDEVFSAFPLLEDGSRVTTILSAQGPLVFALGGLSKLLALPQVKLSWIAVDGPTHRVQDALTRIDLIADTFLSVSTAAQIAAPRLLAQRSLIQERIFERLEGALETLHRILADSPATVFRVEGGWSAVVRLPNTRSELDWVLALLEEDRVLVHPGWFYDFPSEPFVVLSLMTPPAMFSEGVSRLERRVRAFA